MVYEGVSPSDLHVVDVVLVMWAVCVCVMKVHSMNTVERLL